MLAPRRSPSPEQPATALTVNDLEAVLRALTGHAPTETDLEAVRCLPGTLTPVDESAHGGHHR